MVVGVMKMKPNWYSFSSFVHSLSVFDFNLRNRSRNVCFLLEEQLLEAVETEDETHMIVWVE